MEQNSDKVLIKAYVAQLVSQEKEAYIIAKDHLGSSFDIAKSNGFLNWKALREKDKKK